MAHLQFNMLGEPLFSVQLENGKTTKCSLPQVLARLGQKGPQAISSFAALQIHQAHALHAFLVQLAAIALHLHGLNEQKDVWQDEETWKGFLWSLTQKHDEPWCLYVSDLEKPAFMQPPVPEKSLNSFESCTFPDEIDVLVTAKNHDVKATRIQKPKPEHWVYALLTLQTMQGFLGAGNYGIARMNGGFASRPSVAFTPGASLAARFIRDTTILLAQRQSMVNNHAYQNENGNALLWLLPWDGTKSISLPSCDPYFIEICRRVRFEIHQSSLIARVRPTRAARIEAKAAKGNTGDPWTPVDKKEAKALTVPADGFTYARTQELLLGSDYQPGITQEYYSTDREELFFKLVHWLEVKESPKGFTKDKFLFLREFCALWATPNKKTASPNSPKDK